MKDERRLIRQIFSKKEYFKPPSPPPFCTQTHIHLVYKLSYIIPGTLLQFYQAPAPRIRIIDIFRYPCHPNSIRDKLDFILHPGRELVCFRISIDMHFLRAAGDDEDGDFAWLEHSRCEDIDVADIKDAPVRFETRGCVLLS